MAQKVNGGKSDGGKKQYDDSNRGVLFPNDKGDNDARPDFTGNLSINPADYETGSDGLIRIRLAGWQKHSEKTGADYLSLTAQQQKN